MDTGILVTTVVVLVVLPILGSTLAMGLGALVALRRRPAVARATAGNAWLDVAMSLLRRGAAWLGSRLEDDEAANRAAPARADHTTDGGASHARVEDERRRHERRLDARRHDRRPGLDRRHAERRSASG